ncbi:putative oxidoreductase family, NAD-binding Rossmann fold [Lyophyllum shimeji]|uniref:D-xylose 1-dehydrogenase (NADP(+), D-xylono-1,5-lactone-forming) n=1 Tax=Lyophyllum shimeji TaxID=47721 RepID=A0A9P3UNP6_LYOSH|nr:putative oxidoreductase family, NAD-binding Rossmann fold [Lyophyllum shimeji]
MASVIGFFDRLRKAFNPPPAEPSAEGTRVLKFGILGAANIAPVALIAPAKNHPETVVYAVAARDKARAEAYARKHGIEKVHRTYQELLDDPNVDVIYNPLPNGLHYEWTTKALAAGKHVLLEKPSASTAEETRKMFDLAEKKGLVLMEAFHYRFHPAIQRVKAIIDSGELGAIKHISAVLALPKGIIRSDDIRYKYELGGGALMDMGCYTINFIQYLSSSNPVSVLSATHALHVPPSAPKDFKPTVDRGTTASLALPNNATASLKADLSMPFRFGLIPPMPQVRGTVTCEGGEIELFNFVMPTLYHSLKVTPKQGKARVEKVYSFADAKMEGKGEAWWTTYRFQLEAFVDRLKGRTPQTWVDKEDSIANMECIEQIYEKTGLGSRPKSDFVPPQY